MNPRDQYRNETGEPSVRAIALGEPGTVDTEEYVDWLEVKKEQQHAALKFLYQTQKGVYVEKAYQDRWKSAMHKAEEALR